MGTLLSRFWRNDSGATSIEYALIAAMIAITLVTILQTVGSEVKGPFADVDTGLKKRSLS